MNAFAVSSSIEDAGTFEKESFMLAVGYMWIDVKNTLCVSVSVNVGL